MTTAAQSLTLEEFLKRPETKPASELINGEIVQKPMPQGVHSLIQTHLPLPRKGMKTKSIAYGTRPPITWTLYINGMTL